MDEKLKKLIIKKTDELVEYMKALGYEIPNRKLKIEELVNRLHSSLEEIKCAVLKLSREEFENESWRSVRLLATEAIKNNFGEEFWARTWEDFKKAIESIIEKYRMTYVWITGDELDPLDYDTLEEKIVQDFKDAVKAELEKTFTSRMLDYFNSIFTRDSNGDRINFDLKTEQEIGKLFVALFSLRMIPGTGSFS